jgi:hypothetical protein
MRRSNPLSIIHYLSSVTIFVLALFIIQSCAKTEPTLTDQAEDPTSALQTTITERGDTPACIAAVIKTGNVLQFSDINHFQEVRQALEQQMETHLQNWLDQHPINTEGAYEADLASGAFDPYAPLKAFETSKGFISQGITLRPLIDQWLQTEALDPAQCPINGKSIDPVLGCLLNANNEYRIGGTTHVAQFGTLNPGSQTLLPCSPVGLSTFDAFTNAQRTRRGVVVIALALFQPYFSEVRTAVNYQRKTSTPFGVVIYSAAWTDIRVDHLAAMSNLNCDPSTFSFANASDGPGGFRYRSKRTISNQSFFPSFWTELSNNYDVSSTGTFGSTNSVTVSNAL